MAITSNASGVRAYEVGTTGQTGLVFRFLKNDLKTATLRIQLVDPSGNVIDQYDVDVSGQAVGSEAQYSATLSNGLSRATVSATDYVQDTVAANSSKQYTVPTGQVWVIITDIGDITDRNGFSYGVAAVVPEGETVTVTAGPAQVTVEIYKFDAATFPSATFTLRAQELDPAGNVLYEYTYSIVDYPPLSISTGEAGGVTILQIT